MSLNEIIKIGTRIKRIRMDKKYLNELLPKHWEFHIRLIQTMKTIIENLITIL